MEKFNDLHVHTTASDGSMTPKEVVNYAWNKGLSAIAITDHDTIEGVEDAIIEGIKLGIEVIPGVEISVDYRYEMHILGYFFGYTYKNINNVLEKLKMYREERNPKVVNKLNSLGINIDMNDVNSEASGNIIGRPHIAKVLLNKGYVKTVEEAFDKYLSNGKPAYVEKYKIKPQDGIQAIIKAGGIPVLAHPKLLKVSFKKLDRILSFLTSIGLKGLEVYYVQNTPEDIDDFLKLAEQHKLLVTGGSDFHGLFKPGIDIGRGYGNLEVPYYLLQVLKNFGCI